MSQDNYSDLATYLNSKDNFTEFDVVSAFLYFIHSDDCPRGPRQKDRIRKTMLNQKYFELEQFKSFRISIYASSGCYWSEPNKSSREYCEVLKLNFTFYDLLDSIRQAFNNPDSEVEFNSSSHLSTSKDIFTIVHIINIEKVIKLSVKVNKIELLGLMEYSIVEFFKFNVRLLALEEYMNDTNRLYSVYRPGKIELLCYIENFYIDDDGTDYLVVHYCNFHRTRGEYDCSYSRDVPKKIVHDSLYVDQKNGIENLHDLIYDSDFKMNIIRFRNNFGPYYS